MNKKQKELEECRKKRLRYDTAALILMPVALFLILFGSWLTWLIMIIVSFTLPLYQKKRMELVEIEFGLEESKKGDVAVIKKSMITSDEWATLILIPFLLIVLSIFYINMNKNGSFRDITYSYIPLLIGIVWIGFLVHSTCTKVKKK